MSHLGHEIGLDNSTDDRLLFRNVLPQKSLFLEFRLLQHQAAEEQAITEETSSHCVTLAHLH